MKRYQTAWWVGRLVLAAGLAVGGGRPADAENLNLRLGPLSARATLGAQVGVEYTDNVDLEEENPQSDFLFNIGPTVDLTTGAGEGIGPIIRLPGGEEFRFRLNLDFSVRYSLRDGVVQDYGAPITVDILIPIQLRSSGWVVTLSETFDHTRRTAETTFGFGQRDLSVYENNLSLNISRSFGLTSLTAGARRNDQITTDREFEDQDFVRYTFFVTPSYLINPAMSVFWANSYTITDVQESDSRDSKGWSTSLGISGLIMQQLSGSVSIGYSQNTIEAGVSGGVFEEERTTGGLNNNVTLNYSNPLRPMTTHSVSGFHSLDVPAGLRNSGLTEAYGLTYRISHVLNRRVTLSPFVSWTHQTDLEDDADSETVDTVRAGIGLSRRLTDRLSGRFEYRYQLRDSNIDGQSYQENSVSASLRYVF